MMAQYEARGVMTVFVGDLPDDDNTPADYIAGDVLICEESKLA